MATVPARNKALIRRLIEFGWNGDLTVLEHTVAEDYLAHFAAHRGEVLGIAGAKEMVADMHAALNGMRCRVHDLIAERDRVVARVTCHGDGEVISTIVIFRIVEQRIVESWEDVDPLQCAKRTEYQQ